jgi:V/A-type H+-transporting ATPase subunit A
MERSQDRLREIVRLVGIDALSRQERMILETAKSLREDFLHQNAFHEIDTYASMDKQYKMLRNIIYFHHLGKEALEHGSTIQNVFSLPVRDEIARMRYIDEKELEKIDELMPRMKKEVDDLMPEGGMGDVA